MPPHTWWACILCSAWVFVNRNKRNLGHMLSHLSTLCFFFVYHLHLINLKFSQFCYIIAIRWHETQYIHFSGSEYILVDLSSCCLPNFSTITWKISNIRKNMVLQKTFMLLLFSFNNYYPWSVLFQIYPQCYHPPLSYLKANCRLHIISSVNIFIYISKTKSLFLEMWLQNSHYFINF